MSGNYRLEADGLIYYPEPKKDSDGTEVEQHELWLCAPLEVMSLAIDEEERWGKMLRWLDPNQEPVWWVMPNKLLAKKDELWQELLGRGLAITDDPNGRNKLHSYLNRQQPDKRARVVSRLGWYLDGDATAFVLPDAVYGDPGGGQIVYQNRNHNPYAAKGTIAEWSDRIGQLCVGNSRLVVAVSTGFTSSLLLLVGEESGGLHFQGDSRAGKTTVLMVGASVGGRPKDITILWRATSNGLEAICEERCDGVMCLDEMGQVDAKEAGEIAYMIANNKGKSRMSRNIEARKSKEWRILFLSSGEISLADKMTENGKKPRAGQEVRLLDIPADAGSGMGIFENLHGAGSPGEFAEQLRRAAQDIYGAPLRGFIDAIATAYADDPERLKSALRKTRDEFIRDHLPAGASGQVRTAYGRFGLIAAAGEIATRFELTGWPEGEAARAAVKCFQAWLAKRGTIGDHDLEAGIRQVIAYLERHGSSRFEDWDYEGTTAPNRVGFRKGITGDGGRHCEYYVLPQAWKDELCRGYDAKAIAKAMVERYRLSPKIISGEPDARSRPERKQDFIAELLREPSLCDVTPLSDEPEGTTTTTKQPEQSKQPAKQLW